MGRRLSVEVTESSEAASDAGLEKRESVDGAPGYDPGLWFVGVLPPEESSGGLVGVLSPSGELASSTWEGRVCIRQDMLDIFTESPTPGTIPNVRSPTCESMMSSASAVSPSEFDSERSCSVVDDLCTFSSGVEPDLSSSRLLLGVIEM